MQKFDRLVQLTGSSAKDLQNSANARVAYSRLAELNRMAGKNEEAIRMFLKLNEALPNQVAYIKNLAITHVAAKQYEQAVLILKRVIAGVTPGSDSWFEAKLLLAECLHSTDQTEDARKLIRQTIRLGGDMPADWQARFEALKNRMDQSLIQKN